MTVPMGPASARKRNINIWKKIRVFTATEADAKVGADGTFDPLVWGYVGVMASGSNMNRAPEITRDPINAFGNEFIMNNIDFTKDVRVVTALEDNATSFAIMHPGSEYVEEGASVLMAPLRDAEVIVAFESTNSWGDKYIEISREFATAYSTAGQSRADDGAASAEITFEIPMGDDEGLYDQLIIRADDDAIVTPLDPIRIEEPVLP